MLTRLRELNPYLVRHNIRLTLITTLFTFFLYSTFDLVTVKHAYIERYIELHYEVFFSLQPDEHYGLNPSASNPSEAKIRLEHDYMVQHGSQHRPEPLQASNLVASSSNESMPDLLPIQVDEEIDGSDSSTATNASNLTHPTVVTNAWDASLHEDDWNSEPFDSEPRLSDGHLAQIRLYAWLVVLFVFFFELLYLAMYLHILLRHRFCPVMCFATLSTVSLLTRLYQHVTSILEGAHVHYREDYPALHSRTHFRAHLRQMDLESLLHHMMHFSTLELLLATVETVLAWIYAIMLRLYPGFHRSHLYSRYRGFQQHPQQLCNGHAVEMSNLPGGRLHLDSVDEADDEDDDAEDPPQPNALVDNNNVNNARQEMAPQPPPPPAPAPIANGSVGNRSGRNAVKMMMVMNAR